MFNRQEFKSNAKEVLRRNYWWGVLAIVIVCAISYGVSLVTTFPSMLNPENMGLFAATNVFSLAVTILVLYPIAIIGMANFFLNLFKKEKDLGDLFVAFKKDNYANAVIVPFLTYLFIFLWSLLLIIPGIIKSLSYSLTPYIMSEYPHLKGTTAITLSRKMTRGFKGDIFVLYLSFIGWYLLGALACGIGIVFVEPYVQATVANMYMRLKAIAFENGVVTESDFAL